MIRQFLFLGVVALVGVGCNSTTGGSPPAATCVARTCGQLNQTCGDIDDGCGHKISCGQCEVGSVCGPYGRCTACTPRGCGDVGANCGTVADGCGGTIECGSCNGTDTCGGGGAPNRCGRDRCVSTTCAALGRACGLASNGCDSVLDCGGCGDNQTCTEDGHCVAVSTAPGCTPKTCAADECGAVSDGCGGSLDCGPCPTTTNEPPAWMISEPGISAIDADASGTVFYVKANSPVATHSILGRLNASGERTWSKEFATNFTGVMAAPTADQLMLSGEQHRDTCGAMYCDDPVLEHFNKSGDGPSWTQKGAGPTGFAVLAVADDGTEVDGIAPDSGADSDTVRHDDSTSLTIQGSILGNGFMPGPAALLSNGDVAFAGGLDGTWNYRGHSFGKEGERSVLVLVTDRSGALKWGRVFPGAGSALGIGGTSAGTVVALISFSGTISFAGQSYSAGADARALMAVFEANGDERFARGPIGYDVGSWLSPRLAVDPIGRAFIAYGTPSSFVFLKYGLDGQLLWRREYSRDPGDAEVDALRIAGHSALFLGRSSGTVDFAGQKTTPNVPFLIELSP